MTKSRQAKPKNGEKVANATSAQEAAPQAKEVAFSVRLTTEEHERLKNAAAARGWTPTNLIRTATLERAAHILNTSRVTTFNFKGLAVKLADQLFNPRRVPVKYSDEEWNPCPAGCDWDALQDWLPQEVVAEALPIDVLPELRKAVRLGGGEFLGQILEYCEGLTAPKRLDVPEPIEPPTPTA